MGGRHGGPARLSCPPRRHQAECATFRPQVGGRGLLSTGLEQVRVWGWFFLALVHNQRAHHHHSWSPSPARLTSEPPTRSTRICTPAPGHKGAPRRKAMASGHPCPRTPTSKRADYRVGGPPLAGDACGDECALQQPEQPQPTKAQVPCKTRGFAVGDEPDEDSAGCGFESHGAYKTACRSTPVEA